MKRRSNIGLLVGGLMLVGLSGGCLGPKTVWEVRDDIRGVLDAQAQAWNAGDLDAFMDGYTRSRQLTFSAGGNVTRGWEKTRSNYRVRYPTREAMGLLKFDSIEVEPLGENAAYVLGRWYLKRDEPISGAFTLVMRREAGEWRIIHDHTSRDAR